MWKLLNKEVALGEPRSFLDHVYLGCTQRKCEISKDIVDNYRNMFESRISVGTTEKIPCSENLRISSWSYDMEGHAKKCVERYCELANKTTQQLYKVSTPCIDDHHFKEEETKSVGELSHENCQKYALKLFWNAETWHELDDLIFDGQWTNLHDRSQNGPKVVTNDYVVWFLTFIMHVNTNSIAMWETLPNNADWDCFRTLISRETPKIQNTLRGEHCAYSEVIHLSNKLDVQETNCCSSQLNRIWDYLSGHVTEIGWFARSGTMGFNCFCSRKFLVFQIDRGNLMGSDRRSSWKHTNQSNKEQGDLLVNKREVRSTLHTIQETKAISGSDQWFGQWRFIPQTSNLRVKKLYCMCLRTMKLWSRWSLKAEVLQWDMFPEPTELHLIGCSIELIWTPKSKSNTLTPKTNSQTS